jgi:hypothetical protein
MKLQIILLLCITQALADTPEIPQNVASQWAQFQTALKADDLSILLSMVKFPLQSNEFGDIKTPKAFREQYKTIFPEKTKDCFLTSSLNPQKWKKQVFYEAWCEPIRFTFKQVGTKLFLTDIDNVNE